MKLSRYKLLTDTLYSLEEMIKEHKEAKADQKDYTSFVIRRNEILTELYDAGYIKNSEWSDWLLTDKKPFVDIPEEFLEKAIQMQHVPNPTNYSIDKAKVKMTEIEFLANVTMWDYGERNIYSGALSEPNKKIPEYFRMDIKLNADYIINEHEVIVGRMIKSAFKNFQDHITNLTKD